MNLVNEVLVINRVRILILFNKEGLLALISSIHCVNVSPEPMKSSTKAKYSFFPRFKFFNSENLVKSITSILKLLIILLLDIKALKIYMIK